MFELLAWGFIWVGIIGIAAGIVGVIYPPAVAKKGDSPPSRKEILVGAITVCAVCFTLGGLGLYEKEKSTQKAELWQYDTQASLLSKEAEQALAKACPGLVDAAAKRELVDVTSGLQSTVGVVKGSEVLRPGSKELSVFGIRNVVNVNISFKAVNSGQGSDPSESVCTFDVSNRGIAVHQAHCRRLCGVSATMFDQSDLLPLPQGTTFTIDDTLRLPDKNESIRNLRLQ